MNNLELRNENIKRIHQYLEFQSQLQGSGVTQGLLFISESSSNWPPDSKRRKKSRWGAEETRATAAVIPANLSKEQEQQVLCKHKFCSNSVI